jgi:tetratricopeptide (TPR) repeat protein
MSLRALCLCLAIGITVSPYNFAQETDCTVKAYDCAAAYLKQRKFEAAIQALNKELEESPNNPKALNLLGIALTEMGQREKANAKFREALQLDPHFHAARKNLAINEFHFGHFAKSEKDLEGVLKDAPGDEVANVYLAEIEFQRKDCAAALKHYGKARAVLVRNPVWILHKGECLLASDHNLEQAQVVWRSLPSDDGEDRFQAGLLLGKAGAYPAAAQFFRSAREKYNDPYIAVYNELLMLNEAGEWAKSIKVFQELPAERYRRAELYNLVSEAYVKTGQIQEAYDALRKATQMEPGAEDNYVDLAALCLEYEEFTLGMDILNIGVHYVPNSYRLYVQRGVMLVMKGSMAEAERDFQTASQLAPDKSLPYFALGEVWIQEGQAEKAVSVLREKNSRLGVDFLVPYIFAVALIRAGADPGTPAADEAVDALRRSIQLNGSFSHSHAELGKLLFKEGDVDGAITELKAASALDADDAGPVYVLAQAYRKKGDKAESEAQLAKVARLHSEEHKLDLKKELKRLVRQDTASSAQPNQARP